MIEPDLIVDILQRIRELYGLPETVATQVERDARQYWGGERCYIAKAGESPRRREAFERAERVRADHARGERIPLLARRYQLTTRHVRRLLGMSEEAAQAANDDTRRRPLPERKSRVRPKPEGTA